MNVAEWPDTHGIHHRRILWSSNRKLASVGFEPTTTEFNSDAVTNWVIWRWVQITFKANFVQLLQFHFFVQRQISFFLLLSSVATVILIFVAALYIYIYICIYIYKLYIFHIYIYIYYIYIYICIYNWYNWYTLLFLFRPWSLCNAVIL